ncbi:iron ABC transporter permease [Paenibacillus sp. ACRRX]|uniref:FecCD family ABC transporter permease n=1 Tax=Paenibacillus sp. ACRRX TaxID=2918206 RepID=UPI001EF5A546|nr:iron ABC transporter permease [Paenibacillus sp. ACRRX]MCG7409449.1 iron ABC transporter permease [Paenibacillus sp. ACRRX]
MNGSFLTRSSKRKLAGLAVSAILLLISMLCSVLYGLHYFGLKDLWQAYSHFDGSNEHLILTTARVPRTLVAALVGASLAVAGAIMQVLTRNPLASPSVLGVNAGAVLFIVIGLLAFGSSLTMSGMVWLAFAGAVATSAAVYTLGLQGGGFEPVKLTLAGACMAAFTSSITSGIILIDKQSLESALFWMIGSVEGRDLEHLLMVLPYMVIGLAISLLLASSLNIMALGDDSARNLGQRLTLVRVLSAAAIVLLAGSSVAAAGPIAFVGLIVPHLCRYMIGHDFKWLLPYTAIVGAILLVTADLASRFILETKEVPVGVATAIIGVPFLIHVARRKQHA